MCVQMCFCTYTWRGKEVIECLILAVFLPNFHDIYPFTELRGKLVGAYHHNPSSFTSYCAGIIGVRSQFHPFTQVF